MAAEKSPAFQFYPKDFLADAHVVAMTLPERGAYITLLCMCWTDGSLPVDMAALARRCHVSTGTFTRLWPALEPCFTLTDGRLVQPRIERERRKQIAWREMKKIAGQKGGRPKVTAKGTKSLDKPLKQESRTKPEDNLGLTKGKPKQSPPSPSPSSSSSLKEKAAAAPHLVPRDNLSVITKIAHEAIDIEGVNAELGLLGDAVKSLCAIRNIEYGSAVVRKAVDSALAQRRRAS